MIFVCIIRVSLALRVRVENQVWTAVTELRYTIDSNFVTYLSINIFLNQKGS